MLYHGPVRVPGDARPGTALLRFELPKTSGHTSMPTDIEVKLVRANAAQGEQREDER
jgi:hypothetical protein